jgi:hypothetical protein
LSAAKSRTPAGRGYPQTKKTLSGCDRDKTKNKHYEQTLNILDNRFRLIFSWNKKKSLSLFLLSKKKGFLNFYDLRNFVKNRYVEVSFSETLLILNIIQIPCQK